MQAVGLKTYIWDNNFCSGLLLLGFPVLLTGMLWALEIMAVGMGWIPRQGVTLSAEIAASLGSLPFMVVVAVVVAVIWYVIAYFTYQDIIDAVVGARRVTRAEQPELWNPLENLCISRGLTMPDLRVCDSFTRNAWASGISDKRAVVTVTSGLLDALDKDELEAVLAHELTHVINRDSRLLVICAVFAGVITLVSQLIVRVTWYGGRGSRDARRGGGALILIALAAAAVGYVLAIVIRMAISRRREFLADAGAVELTKNPDAMISALLKVEGHSDHIDAPGFVQTMFFDHHEEGFASLFETHPSIEARVQALVKFAHGRMPEWTPSPAVEAALGGAATPETPVPAAHAEPAVPVTKRGPWG